jgi:TrmH family RNA methyltransferase
LRIRENADLSQVIDATPGPVVATVARDAQSIYDLDLSGPVAWLFGNEGSGVSPELIARADLKATIPLVKGSESLNVSAAAAVCLFEALRQRHFRT